MRIRPKALESNGSIAKLHLQIGKIGDEGAIAIAKALETNKMNLLFGTAKGWKEDNVDLGALPNNFCKISGIVARAQKG